MESHSAEPYRAPPKQLSVLRNLMEVLLFDISQIGVNSTWQRFRRRGEAIICLLLGFQSGSMNMLACIHILDPFGLFVPVYEII
jgi:hypothetical protein